MKLDFNSVHRLAVNKFLTENPRHQSNGVSMADVIICADGFRMSVQAHTIVQSLPRRCNFAWPLEAFEVLIEERKTEPFLDVYYDKYSCAGCDHSIYAYVPVAIIEDVIRRHGGYDLSWLNSLTSLSDKVVVNMTQQHKGIDPLWADVLR